MSAPDSIVRLPALDGLAVFEHEAMATRFTLHLAPSAEGDLRTIAEEAFRLLDRIEDRLSFYREGSDVTRINRAAPGETLRLDDATYRALLIALEVAAASDGAFDPFVGAAAITAKRQPRPAHLADLTPPAPDDMRPVIAIDPQAALVTKLEGQRWLDLGGVGKGVALELLATLLREWEVPAAVLVAGGSSVLVYGRCPSSTDGNWTLVLPQVAGAPQVSLPAPFALGASGEGFQPGHIIAAAPTQGRRQALVLAPDAGLADALSTATLLMPDAALYTLLADAPEVSLLAVSSTGTLLRRGAFEALQLPPPKMALVLPCWCESQRLGAFLEPLATALGVAELPIEVLVVDDGSPTENARDTAKLVADVATRHPIVKPMLSVDRHKGKGGAVYWGWHYAAPEAQWLAFVDADGAIPPAEVVRGLQTVLASGETKANVLWAATRYHDDHSRRVRRGWFRQRSGGWFARWARDQLGLAADDVQCGFKVFPAAWWRGRDGWTEFGYAFDLELLLAAKADGLKTVNIPIVWSEIAGSHVTLRDGLKLVQTVKRMRQG